MTVAARVKDIHQYWTRQAQEHGQSPSASWSDYRVIEMEIREILPRLQDGERVLDVGCGNGYSTVQFASQRAISIRGVDVIPEMITCARQRLAVLPETMRQRIEFAVGDVTALPDAAGA